MPSIHARDVLTHLIADEPISPDDLDLLVSGKEHHLVEYKSGQLLTAHERDHEGLAPVDNIRKAVAGFANADGGILVLGYDEKTKTFDGARAPAEDPDVGAWISRVLQPLAAHLFPSPRGREIQHHRVPVFLLGIPRTTALAPCVLKGRLVYYARFGDTTLPMPEWLLTDIHLGRRTRPRLNLTPRRSFSLNFDEDRSWAQLSGNVHARYVALRFAIENRSIVFADDVRAGLISWSLHPMPSDQKGWLPPPQTATTPAPTFVREHIQYANPQENTREAWRGSWMDVHAVRGLGDLAPFDTGALDFPHILLPVYDDHTGGSPPPAGDPQARDQWALRRGQLRLRAAVYLTGRNVEPWWFSVSMIYGEHGALALPTVEPVTSGSPTVALEIVPAEG